MSSSKKRTFLVEKRKKRRLSQGSIASYLGISRTYYTNIENGDRNPSLEVALKIADFFGIDVKQLRG
ncbi:helix-turn-helix transcriptional regulator [Mesobacillus thioparans]|jgi:putative transcriptional regulator|uniref:helix-turn-helix transcriptional regulator n=1 Tax=Mesobacillus thioparans TaxID=370439 RepID=UPI0039EF5A80